LLKARPTLESLVPILRRALRAERALPRDRREQPHVEPSIAAMLGICFAWLDELKKPWTFTPTALLIQPDDWELLTLRGISRFDSARRQALQDLRRAAGAGAPSFWPYYLLAQDDFEAERYHECRQWCLQALERRQLRDVQCADTRVAWDLPADSQRIASLPLRNARLRRIRSLPASRISARSKLFKDNTGDS